MIIRKTTLILIMGTSLLLGGTTVTAQNGTALAEKCERCHGNNGNSDKKQVPNITGLSSTYFIDTMEKFRNDKRPGKKFKTSGHEETDMNAIAKNISHEDFAVLADYYATQTFIPRQQTVDSALVRQGKKVYRKRCKKCHTDNGSNSDDDAGRLAGQWMPYLEFQLEQFSSGVRTPSKKMKKQLKKLKDGDIQALLNFFAAQQ